MMRVRTLQVFSTRSTFTLQVQELPPPEVPVPPPRVHNAQPTRVDNEGTSSNLRSRGKKTPIPYFSLSEQFQKIHEANAVTHQISGVAQEYRHLIKGPERKFW